MSETRVEYLIRLFAGLTTAENVKLLWALDMAVCEQNYDKISNTLYSSEPSSSFLDDLEAGINKATKNRK